MDHRMQEMLDHHEIRKLLVEYCRACDRLDVTGMARVYAKDSFDDHGDLKCPGPEFSARILGRLARTTDMCSHHLGQSTIEVQGDEAGAETYFIASLRRRSRNGTELLEQMGGRYVDRLRREDGAWKIWRRTCVRDWSTSHLVRDWLEGFGFVEGGRSRQDPSYAALGWPGERV